MVKRQRDIPVEPRQRRERARSRRLRRVIKVHRNTRRRGVAVVHRRRGRRGAARALRHGSRSALEAHTQRRLRGYIGFQVNVVQLDERRRTSKQRENVRHRRTEGHVLKRDHIDPISHVTCSRVAIVSATFAISEV